MLLAFCTRADREILVRTKTIFTANGVEDAIF